MYTIFGPASSMPWKCILYSDLKTRDAGSDRSTCVYYDHSACILCYMAHVPRNSGRVVWGAKPPWASKGVFCSLLTPSTFRGPLEYNVHLARWLAGTWYGHESQISDYQLRSYVEVSVVETIQHASRVGGYAYKITGSVTFPTSRLCFSRQQLKLMSI